MALRNYNPTSPGRRGLVLVNKSELWKGKPEKSLVEGLSGKGGRNNQGRITARRRGGGHKRRYRIIDFKRNKAGVPGEVSSIEYDPNRSANIALVFYEDGEKRYILHPKGLNVGDTIMSGPNADVLIGSAMPLALVPLGTTVHNIELKPGKGGQLARSAGASVQVVAKEGDFVTLRLPSTEMRRFRKECMATIGEVGNSDHELTVIGKAGANRWRGKRPKVRGVAMNPVDHPLGGGEGRSSGGRPPVSPWGKAEGKKTRNKKKESTKYIVRGRKRGKATQ